MLFCGKRKVTTKDTKAGTKGAKERWHFVWPHLVGFRIASLSLRKERDVAQRQGEVTLSPFAFFWTIRLTTSQERLIKVTTTAKPYPLTSPCFGVAKTSLSFRKERDVAQRQGEVTLSPFAFFWTIFSVVSLLIKRFNHSNKGRGTNSAFCLINDFKHWRASHLRR